MCAVWQRTDTLETASDSTGRHGETTRTWRGWADVARSPQHCPSLERAVQQERNSGRRRVMPYARGCLWRTRTHTVACVHNEQDALNYNYICKPGVRGGCVSRHVHGCRLVRPEICSRIKFAHAAPLVTACIHMRIYIHPHAQTGPVHAWLWVARKARERAWGSKTTCTVPPSWLQVSCAASGCRRQARARFTLPAC